MTDQLNSQLSAFVDEALSEAESELLVRRLCRDTDLRATLARYALIGDVLRGDMAVPASGSFARRVMMAVDGQPMPQAEARDDSRRFGMRPLAAAAVAAIAVGVVALVTSVDRDGPPAGAAAVAAIETTAEPSEVPLTLVDTGDELVTPARFNVPMQVPANRQSQEARARLNSYLVQHYSTTGPRQNLVVYRNVGYNPAEQPN